MMSSRFMRAAAPALGFGFLISFGSSAGQTYFISLFAGEIRADLGLTHGGFGTLYTLATLASAAALVWLGKLTDRLDLPFLSVFSLLGLSGCAMLMAGANSVIVLIFALFGLRLFGQGLLSHIAITAMGRWFSVERGRALSVATLGFPVGEALLPVLAAFFLTLYTWRNIWVGASVCMIIMILPLLLWLGHLVRVRGLDRPRNNVQGSEVPGRLSWTRAQVLRDPRFYGLLPGLLAPPFIITGVLFHQIHLIDTKSWTLSAFAACYPLYAISATVIALGAGWMVDRSGAVSLLRFYLVPLAVGLALLAVTDEIFAAAAFMILMGATGGSATVVLGALWAELYGTDHLGAIRSLSVALLVLSTAISPGLMGLLIDARLGLNSQFAMLSIYVFACAIFFAVMSPSLLRERQPPAPT
ncbi:MAG: MFS transporter [Rhodospirillaceae bacterium]|nr:MFS transporter [Rhodospirillaceae bacterium]